MRGKGEGSVYKRSDGLWCTSIELPEGPDGKRRRKVVCRKDKPAVIKVMREHQKQLAAQGDLITSSTTVEKWMCHWLYDVAPLKMRPKPLSGDVLDAIADAMASDDDEDDAREAGKRKIASAVMW